MALVIVPVIYPAVLTGQSNGELPDRILVSTPGLQGGPTVRLVTTATRCWRAMCARALDDGVVLRATSFGDSYRWLSLQVSTFTDRYQLEPTGNGYRLWDSDGNGTRERWYKKDGVATAAVPGTSKHGWALAVDVANASGVRLRWLEVNAPRFGWSWETLPEEPWHIRAVTGDAIPAAVLAYEKEQQDMTPEQALSLERAEAYAFWGVLNLEDPYRVPGSTSKVDNKLANALVDLKAQLNDLQSRPPVQPAPVDVEALAAALAGNATFVAALAAAVEPVVRDAVADLGEGGAAQVRADAD